MQAIIVEGNINEIAALVLAVQERQKNSAGQTDKANATQAASSLVGYTRNIITNLSEADVALVSLFSSLGLYDRDKSL